MLKTTLENSAHLQNRSIEKIDLAGDGTKGTEENIDFNGVCVRITDLLSPGIYEERVSSTFSGLKLHFTIKGSYRFPFLENSEGVAIPQGYCNLYHYKKIEGTQKSRGERITTVAVLFGKTYLKTLLGESCTKVFEDIEGLTTNNNASCLWESSKRITPELMSYVMAILNCPYTGCTKTSFVKAKTDCLLIAFFLGKHPYFNNDWDILPKMDYKAILKVETYMRQNLEKRLTIDHLSALAGLNTTKLKHDFKKVFSTTVFKYITKLRMENAKRLILDNDFSIAQAAYEVGYTNPQHFTVAFKKTMGYLPSRLKGNEL